MKSLYYSNKEELVNAFSHLFFAFIVLFFYFNNYNLVSSVFFLTFLISFCFHFFQHGLLKKILVVIDGLMVMFSFVVAVFSLSHLIKVPVWIMYLFFFNILFIIILNLKYSLYGPMWKKTFMAMFLSAVFYSFILIYFIQIEGFSKILLTFCISILICSCYFYYNYHKKYYHLIFHLLTGISSVLFLFLLKDIL